MSHEECREWIEIELFDAIDGEAGRMNLHLAFCPACDRHRVERREMKALAEDAPVGETEDVRLQRVLAGFGRVLDAQLAECDEWELRGDFCVNPITICQLTGGQHYLRAAGDGAARTYALLALETANPRGQTSGEDAMWTNLIELAKHNADEIVH